MYRALALKTVRRGIDPADEEAVAKLVASSQVELRPDPDSGTRLILDGEEVDESIRGPGVSAVASTIAMQAAVRERLVEVQRRSAAAGGVVEGRDIGTVVFPDTPHKFFLDARLEVRRERRLADRRRSDPSLSAVTVQAEIELRDRRDRARSLSPLRSDSSYVVLDTSEMTPDEVVQRMVERVEETRSRLSSASQPVGVADGALRKC